MDYEEIINKLISLNERSEERIDRTNDMVCKMVEVCTHSHTVLDKVTNEYIKHLDNLASCRNDLLEQNKTLLRLHEQDLDNLRGMRQEITDNRNRIFDLIKSFGQGTVRIENK